MRTHPFAPVSLVFGLIFAGVGVAFLPGDVTVWQLDWSWVWPVILLATGTGVLLSLVADVRARRTTPDGSGPDITDLDTDDDSMASRFE